MFSEYTVYYIALYFTQVHVNKAKLNRPRMAILWWKFEIFELGLIAVRNEIRNFWAWSYFGVKFTYYTLSYIDLRICNSFYQSLDFASQSRNYLTFKLWTSWISKFCSVQLNYLLTISKHLKMRMKNVWNFAVERTYHAVNEVKQSDLDVDLPLVISCLKNWKFLKTWLARCTKRESWNELYMYSKAMFELIWPSMIKIL